MLEVSNTTAFVTACIPHTDVDGRDLLVTVIKGTFRIHPGNDDLSLAEEQEPIIWADQFFREPGTSSICRESDICPPKVGGDAILIGHAYARRSGVREKEVTLSVGSMKKTVRVVGDRVWHKALTGWQPTAAAPFERMPLVFERAFGGRDTMVPESGGDNYERRNPVGTGFVAAKSPDRLEGLALPNLEDPANPIRSWKDRPEPAGFGFVGRDWMPRAALAGTYDDRWQANRCPLLPEDFDPRYFNAAASGLVAPTGFSGGEPVRISGTHPSGDLAFRLPVQRLAVTAWIKGTPRRAAANLDTVVIKPDEERAILVWRVVIPCNREFLYISNVFIKEAGR